MAADNIKMLLGNHELMMLCSLGDEKYIEQVRYNDPYINEDIWFNNHGWVTKEAFLNQPPKVQKKILAFLRDLPINIDVTVGQQRFKLVHAAPVTRFASYRRSLNYYYQRYSKVEYAVWYRLGDGDRPPRGYTLIYGHTPTIKYQNNKPLEIYKRKNMICIDCGSGYSSVNLPGARLACLRLDDMKVFYSEER